MATIIGTELLNATVRTLAELKPCPFAGRVTEDQIKLALCDGLDIWPASIADEVLANAISEL